MAAAAFDPACLPEGRPVLIAGPTASGKSALALAIAQARGRVVVNADALQVYGRWRVLSARPGPQDCAAVPHLLYGHVTDEAPYSAGHWLREVSAVLDRHPDGPATIHEAPRSLALKQLVRQNVAHTDDTRPRI